MNFLDSISKDTHIKFHENLSSGSPVASCGLLSGIRTTGPLPRKVFLVPALHQAADCASPVISLYKQLTKLLLSAPEHLSKHLALGLNTPNEIIAQAAADTKPLRKSALPQRKRLFSAARICGAAFALKSTADAFGFNVYSNCRQYRVSAISYTQLMYHCMKWAAIAQSV